MNLNLMAASRTLRSLPAWLCLALPLAAGHASAAKPSSGMAAALDGAVCTGEIRIPDEDGPQRITLHFDAPDVHGPQGRYRLMESSSSAGDFYDCREQGDQLQCTYDAGRASGPLNMKVLRNGQEIHGVFNSPFAYSVPMSFKVRCQKAQ